MENKNIYVGHRYVPKIIGVHDSSQAYEGLSIVTHEGTSYTSKKYVPEGVCITNEEFWVVTGNYNVQVEHYRNEVNQIKKSQDNIISEISDVKTNHDDLKTDYEKSKVKLNNLSYGIFNVLDYNMTIDGETDNTNEFNTIINDISENGGGILEIPYHENEIIISDSLNLPSNITINGNGNTIKSKSTSNETTPFYFTNKENIVIENVKIDGMKELKDNQQSVTGGSNGITFTNQCKNIIISNCHIYNTLEHGIHFLSRVSDDGKRVEHCENIVVENCLFENNGNKYWHVGNRGAGIMCFNGAINIKIVNNTFKDFVAVGAYIDSAYNTKERLENLYPLIKVDNDEYMGDNVIVTGNTFLMTVDHWTNNPSNTGVGIVLHGQKNVIVSNNIIRLDKGNYRGISISAGQEVSNTRNIIVEGNNVLSTSFTIEVTSSKEIYIMNNKLKSINEYVIVTRSLSKSYSDIFIINNIITNENTRHGVYIENTSDEFTLDNIYVKDNIITLKEEGNVNACIFVFGKCEFAEVKNNIVKLGKYGIRVDSKVKKVNITSNVIKNADTGVYATGIGVVAFNTILDCVRPLGLNTIQDQYNVTE